MRKLVLGLGVALVGLAGGCGTSDTVGTITAQWSFVTVDGQGALSAPIPCPPNGTTAAVHTTRLDANGVKIGGTEKIDLFNCSDNAGSLPRAPAAYLAFVEFTNDAGTSVY